MKKFFILTWIFTTYCATHAFATYYEQKESSIVLLSKQIQEVTESPINKSIPWFQNVLEQTAIDAIKELASFYHEKGENIKACAYVLNLIAYEQNEPIKKKERALKYLKTHWKLDDSIIQKGYYLQLKLNGLQKRYTGGL